MKASRKRVLADFCPQVLFYTFQFELASLLILTKADELSVQLNLFTGDLLRLPGLPIAQTLRQEAR